MISITHIKSHSYYKMTNSQHVVILRYDIVIFCDLIIWCHFFLKHLGNISSLFKRLSPRKPGPTIVSVCHRTPKQQLVLGDNCESISIRDSNRFESIRSVSQKIGTSDSIVLVVGVCMPNQRSIDGLPQLTRQSNIQWKRKAQGRI